MKVVQIRVYRGEKLSFDENQKVQNENQTIKLMEGLEFNKFMELLGAQGYCKVELVSVQSQGKDNIWREASKAIVEAYEKRVNASFEASKPVVAKTPTQLMKEMNEKHQLEMDKLKNQMAEMQAGFNTTNEE